jgi:hypothetical protein
MAADFSRVYDAFGKGDLFEINAFVVRHGVNVCTEGDKWNVIVHPFPISVGGVSPLR